jgi:hypothetical protein
LVLDQLAAEAAKDGRSAGRALRDAALLLAAPGGERRRGDTRRLFEALLGGIARLPVRQGQPSLQSSRKMDEKPPDAVVFEKLMEQGDECRRSGLAERRTDSSQPIPERANAERARFETNRCILSGAGTPKSEFRLTAARQT